MPLNGPRGKSQAGPEAIEPAFKRGQNRAAGVQSRPEVFLEIHNNMG